MAKKTAQEFTNQIAQDFADNDVGAITAALTRKIYEDIRDSFLKVEVTTTDDIIEAANNPTNLFLTVARVMAAVAANLTINGNTGTITGDALEFTLAQMAGFDVDDPQTPAALWNFTTRPEFGGDGLATTAEQTAAINAAVAALTTSDVPEGSREYFTAARAIAAITRSVLLDLIDNSEGNVDAADSVNAATKIKLTADVPATTTNLAEGNNLYFTAARAIAAITENVVRNLIDNSVGNVDAAESTADADKLMLTFNHQSLLGLIDNDTAGGGDITATQSSNDATKIKLNTPANVVKFRGTWVTNRAYATNNVVVDAGGSFWLAKRDIAASATNVTPVAGDDWQAWSSASGGAPYVLPDNVVQFKGMWATNTAYAINDVVVDANMAFWLAKRAIAASNTNVTPVEGADWRAWGGTSAGGGSGLLLFGENNDVRITDNGFTDVAIDTDATWDNLDELFAWFNLKGNGGRIHAGTIGPITYGNFKSKPDISRNNFASISANNQFSFVDEIDNNIEIGLGRIGENIHIGIQGSNVLQDSIIKFYRRPNNASGGGQPPAQYDEPSISDFSIAGQDPSSPPMAGAALGGDLDVSFTINHPNNVSGNLSLSRQAGNAAAVVLANNIDPNDADGNVTINVAALAAVAGTSYTYRLYGTDTQNPAQTFESTFTLNIAAAHETAYFGTVDIPAGADDVARAAAVNWAGVAIDRADRQADVQNTDYTFNTDDNGATHGISVPNDDFLWVLIPNDREPATIVNSLGSQSKPSWTRTQNVRQIGGEQMDAWTLPNRSGIDLPLFFTFNGS